MTARRRTSLAHPGVGVDERARREPAERGGLQRAQLAVSAAARRHPTRRGRQVRWTTPTKKLVIQTPLIYILDIFCTKFSTENH